MSVLVEVKDLTVRRGSDTIVSGVSFTVEAGSITSLVGPKGAGKTSVVRAISGVIPASGIVNFNGLSLLATPAEARARLGVGHVLEGRHVFSRMTVLENLRVGAYCRKDRRENEMIAEIESLFPRLAERRDQLAGSLCDGDQHMLAIGRSLMSSPRFLIIDEPTRGLLREMADTVLHTVSRLREQGMTMLLVTENEFQMVQLSDTVVALQQGRVVDTRPGSMFDGERWASVCGERVPNYWTARMEA